MREWEIERRGNEARKTACKHHIHIHARNCLHDGVGVDHDGDDLWPSRRSGHILHPHDTQDRPFTCNRIGKRAPAGSASCSGKNAYEGDNNKKFTKTPYETYYSKIQYSKNANLHTGSGRDVTMQHAQRMQMRQASGNLQTKVDQLACFQRRSRFAAHLQKSICASGMRAKGNSNIYMSAIAGACDNLTLPASSNSERQQQEWLLRTYVVRRMANIHSSRSYYMYVQHITTHTPHMPHIPHIHSVRNTHLQQPPKQNATPCCTSHIAHRKSASIAHYRFPLWPCERVCHPCLREHVRTYVRTQT